MSKAGIPTRLPWENRWTEPTLEQLLAPQKDQAREALQLLIEQIEQLDGVQQHIVWYGSAWRWTLEFTLHNESGKEIDKLLYIVPNPEAPVVSVPMRRDTLDHLSLRRLNKYIRDGVRSAKCAVELHWACWTPNSASEVEHLMDLIKRKHKIRRGQGNAASNGNGNGQH